MKIHIYYRHASNCIVKNRPSWFSFEKCWVNFLKTIEGKDNINLTLALDGNIEDDFTKNYKNKCCFICHRFSLFLIGFRVFGGLQDAPIHHTDSY